MGGKTELTTIKTLMEITGQNKEDVQSVLQKFGGDEALAVSRAETRGAAEQARP